MAKIIEKIKSRPLFFTYIFATEISYLMILMDFWFQFSYFHETTMCRVTTFLSLHVGLPVFFLTVLIFFILSFFRSEIRQIRKKIILFFLLHFCLLIAAFCLWFNGR